MIKYRARGYRNETRFAAATCFHCGGVDLAGLPTQTTEAPYFISKPFR